MMRSQFKSPLKLDASNNVAAKGTFDWGSDEEKAVVEVSILQEWGPGKLAKVGIGKAVFMKNASGEDWSLTASSEPAPNQLTAGKALALGIVCALGKEIEMRQFIWQQEIDLEK